MRVELQYFDDAPTGEPLFRGSPTILVDGVDPFPGAALGHLAFRVFATGTGLAGAPATNSFGRRSVPDPSRVTLAAVAGVVCCTATWLAVVSVGAAVGLALVIGAGVLVPLAVGAWVMTSWAGRRPG